MSQKSETSAGGNTVIAYAAPSGEVGSDDYQVTAGGKALFVATAPVLRGGPASYAQFDFSGSVTVTVRAARKIDRVRILPTSSGITWSLSGDTLSFTLTRPVHLSIELNDGIDRPLHLFANPIESRRPSPNDPNVLYFGPGVHEVTTLRPVSGQTIYLAGGAILRAVVAPDEKPVVEKNWRGNKVYAPMIETRNVQGVTVCGRGVFDMRRLPTHARRAMQFIDSRDILVEGITLIDAPEWGVAMRNSKNVVVRNVKEICSQKNSDGVDICNSQNVIVEDCFLRNNDDEVCVKTTLPPPAMESRDIVVRRCVVWNDRARGLGITCETRTNIANVKFEDCDIIHDFAAGRECSALAVLVSDSGTMTDIRFENIRCEDVQNTLIRCWIGKDAWASDETRGHIKGVTFRNIEVTGSTFPVSELIGFDDSHRVEDVTFDGLRIQGQVIRDARTARLEANAYVRGVRFIPSV